jgi:hypothetical protein
LEEEKGGGGAGKEGEGGRNYQRNKARKFSCTESHEAFD